MGRGAPLLTRRRSEEHTSELQSHSEVVCRLLLEKKNHHEPHRTAIGQMLRRQGHACQDIAVARIGRFDPPGGGVEFGDGDSSPFFFNDTATTEIYTLSLHDALPI